MLETGVEELLKINANNNKLKHLERKHHFGANQGTFPGYKYYCHISIST